MATVLDNTVLDHAKVTSRQSFLSHFLRMWSALVCVCHYYLLGMLVKVVGFKCDMHHRGTQTHTQLSLVRLRHPHKYFLLLATVLRPCSLVQFSGKSQLKPVLRVISPIITLKIDC